MNKLLTSIALLALSGSAALAAPEKAPLPPSSYQVTLTKDQIQFLLRALDLASGTCTTQMDGCLIGAQRQVLDPILQSGKPVEGNK